MFVAWSYVFLLYKHFNWAAKSYPSDKGSGRIHEWSHWADRFGAWWIFLDSKTGGFSLLVLWKIQAQTSKISEFFKWWTKDAPLCNGNWWKLGWNWGSSDLLVPVFVEHVSWQKDRFNLLGVCVGVLDWTLWEAVHALQGNDFSRFCSTWFQFENDWGPFFTVGEKVWLLQKLKQISAGYTNCHFQEKCVFLVLKNQVCYPNPRPNFHVFSETWPWSSLETQVLFDLLFLDFVSWGVYIMTK